MQWAAQIDFLNQKGVSTLAFDALGCGKSAKPQSWSAYNPVELYADAKAIFLGELKVKITDHSR